MFDVKKNHFLQALIAVALVWAIIQVHLVLVLFFIAFLFILVLHPLVRLLKRWHFPTPFAVLTPVIGVAALVALIGFFVIPTFVDQIQQFAKQAPTYLHEIQKVPLLKKFNIDTQSVTSYIQTHSDTLSSTLLSITTTAITLVVGMITIIIVTLYGMASYDGLRATFLSYIPANRRARAHDILVRAEKKVVTWVWAQLLLSVAVGIMVWIGSALLGLPFPGILGLISALLEVIPTLGPIVATIPGFLLGLTISLRVAIFAIVLHIIVSQIEAHLLAPLMLGRTVNLHPIIIIFSLLVGTELYGIIGALLAVPVALVISAFVDSFRDGRPAHDLEEATVTGQSP